MSTVHFKFSAILFMYYLALLQLFSVTLFISKQETTLL